MSSEPFTPTPLFSFPLFSTTIAGFEEHREPLVQEILRLRSLYPGIVRSNRNAWHSGREFLEHRNEHVGWLLQKVTKYARLAVGRFHKAWEHDTLELTSCWANVVGAGGWNAPHHHFPCAWSGVYYVSVGPIGKKPDEFDGMIEFLNPTPWLSAIGQGGNYLHGPRDGVTLLFPSSIYHFVHPHFAEQPRISIAYNFNVVPKRAG